MRRELGRDDRWPVRVLHPQQDGCWTRQRRSRQALASWPRASRQTCRWAVVDILIDPRRNNGDDGDDYLERTAVRLRHMASTHSAAREGDAAEVEKRLRNMAYGGSRKRNLPVIISA